MHTITSGSELTVQCGRGTIMASCACASAGTGKGTGRHPVLIRRGLVLQVIWKATTDLGCGAANCKDPAYPTLDATIFVCRYWTQVQPLVVWSLALYVYKCHKMRRWGKIGVLREHCIAMR
jgi:hypothetical protein